MPSFFEKLLPGFYHPKKKDYIQLKRQERDRQEHLAKMQRMADDLYAQNYMDEETYFIFCELAFKEQALDKETADLLIDGIKLLETGIFLCTNLRESKSGMTLSAYDTVIMKASCIKADYSILCGAKSTHRR